MRREMIFNPFAFRVMQTDFSFHPKTEDWKPASDILDGRARGSLLTIGAF
jgi:hypothetical protein